MISDFLEIIDRVAKFLSSREAKRRRVFDNVIRTAYQQLGAVHEDYANMFRTIQKQLPPSFAVKTPQSRAKMQKVTEELGDLRLKFAPVRIALQSLAEELARRQQDAATHDFANALLDYFPDGELRDPTQPARASWDRTASRSLLDRLTAELESPTGIVWDDVIQDTLQELAQGWARVSGVYERLRLDVELQG